jgi:hypothetical protein
MPMTKEWIEKQIADLDKAQEQAVANLNALAGAKQAYNVMLAEMDTKPEEPPKVPRV